MASPVLLRVTRCGLIRRCDHGRGYDLPAVRTYQQDNLWTGMRSIHGTSETVALKSITREKAALPGLARMPTLAIIRAIFTSTIFTSPLLFRPCFALLKRVAESRSKLLNPDLNPILRMVIKPLIYSQFCAGRDKAEIIRSRTSIRSMGFAGIILCYGKENVVSASDRTFAERSSGDSEQSEVEMWEKGNLETLDMISEGDWLGLKFTGAGSSITDALKHDRDPSEHLTSAMNAICHKARSQGCRVWIDAEQHVLQKTIDRWAMDFMRRFNGGKNAVVYNTLQAYLKHSREKLEQQMIVASRENWALGIKLVRGAYIGSDPREIIHDTKAETDESYDGIVRDLLSGTGFGFEKHERPRLNLFLAGHNPHSVSGALDLLSALKQRGQLQVVPDFGQLQGMGDVLGIEAIERAEEMNLATAGGLRPRVFKCLTWGSLQECLQYLVRRMVENSSGADRIQDGRAAMLTELKRRAFQY